MREPGELDQRVTIQGPGTIDDGYGGTIPGGWADVATIWADVQPLRGGEAIANMQVTANQTYRVWMRADVAVTPDNRLVWEGRVLDIREAPPAKRALYRHLVAENKGETVA